ncbi:hypothetical protein HK102_000981, partial [Quaeritorhiza haematococci]
MTGSPSPSHQNDAHTFPSSPSLPSQPTPTTALHTDTPTPDQLPPLSPASLSTTSLHISTPPLNQPTSSQPDSPPTEPECQIQTAPDPPLPPGLPISEEPRENPTNETEVGAEELKEDLERIETGSETGRRRKVGYVFSSEHLKVADLLPVNRKR